ARDTRLGECRIAYLRGTTGLHLATRLRRRRATRHGRSSVGGSPMHPADYRRARQVADTLRLKIERANRPPPPAPTNDSGAVVIPFPASKQRGLVERELVGVRDWETAAAHKWLAGIVRRHERRLQKLGIAPDRIAADVAALEAAFGIGAR